MASRLTPGSESPSEKSPFSTTEASDITPAVPTDVIYKLLGFTLAMVVAPIGTYFLTVNTIFRGNSTWAGATAALMANIVLFAYVIVAMRDDQTEREEANEGKDVKAKKEQ
ncbi:vacuolar ATPase assembly integral membrane protein VMA21 [Polytolypa hystricis UAMH7299]|uniref:Vacuolar ATPase assembly integral membrane protein VMA21 n=1 Tax=Polytolypa hystricis (strain UAMH7299) TaxID=1447883 RepID=A0A2B7YRQ9_POLH7|nr:vacuolar ATPase assembly integral membrane protein VMA21 [Polytolypa hystricis UAMH7299]